MLIRLSSSPRLRGRSLQGLSKLSLTRSLHNGVVAVTDLHEKDVQSR